MDSFLTEMLENSWRSLALGCLEPSHPFRNMVISSYGEGTISMATVVLRAVSVNDRQILFYTDQRSKKVANLKLNNNISVLFYDNPNKVQITLKGKVVIHCQDNITATHWATVDDKGRRSYMAQPGPSSKVDTPIDGLAYINDNQRDEALIAGYQNFATIVITVHFLECLQLKHTGHSRACFNFLDNVWEGGWLIP